MDELVAKLRDIHSQRELKLNWEVEQAFRFIYSGPMASERPVLASSRPPGLVLEPAVVAYLLNELKTTGSDLLIDCAQYASQWAHPPLSAFHVGAAVLSSRGAIVFGVNVELPNLPLHHSIHAEQFAIARLHQVGGSLASLATTASPCGHCRQFLQEVRHEDDAVVFFPNNGQINALKFNELLPHGFGPANLEVNSRVLDTPSRTLTFTAPPAQEDVELAELARKAAESAHVPYSHCASGVALSVPNVMVPASAIECAAYNPSLGPLHAALATLLANGNELASIERVVLVEEDGKVSHEAETRLVIAAIAPAATVQIYKLQNSQ